MPRRRPALGEAIAQRLNKIVRAGESARDCNDKRMKAQIPGAIDAAKKALAAEPNLPAAHLCMATIYETQRLPPDSLIAAATRATLGDSLNPTAWETIARANLTKGDTLKAVDAFRTSCGASRMNTPLRLGIAELLWRQHQYPLAVELLDEGLARRPGDAKMLDLKARICIEGQLGRCTLDGYVQRAAADSGLLSDSTFLKGALGAAQQAGDTQQLVFFSRAAVRHFPSSPAFWKAMGAGVCAAGPGRLDARGVLQVGGAQPDRHEGRAALCQGHRGSGDLRHRRGQSPEERHRAAARSSGRRSPTGSTRRTPTWSGRRASADSSERLTAAVVLLTGGSKLAQAAAYDPAYIWLDEALRTVAAALHGGHHRSPPAGARAGELLVWHRVGGLAPGALQARWSRPRAVPMRKTINERLVRTREALVLGGRVSPSFANTMLSNLAKFEAVMPQVKKQFKCSNF